MAKTGTSAEMSFRSVDVPHAQIHTHAHLGSERSPLQGYFRSFVLLVVSLVLVLVFVAVVVVVVVRGESASRFHSIPNESKIGIRSQLVCVPARMWCARPGSACSAFEFVLV